MSSVKKEKYRKDYTAPKYSITDVYLNFILDPASTRVESEMKIRRIGEHNEPLVLDGEKLKLESVALDGAPAEYTADETSLTVTGVPSEFTLRIVNYISPENNTEFEGLYISEGSFCTQCEAEGFRKITYYLDRPDVSARFTTRIEADKKLYPYLLSNGNRVENGDLPGGRHYVVCSDPYSKPSYLFALVAGNLDMVEDSYVTGSGRRVTIQFFSQPGSRDRVLHAVNSLKQAMKWDEDRFGLEYDLDLFQVVAVDFFNMGAMENKGLNIFNSKYVLADHNTGTDNDFHNIQNVIGHEYFHNWTGDRVTCRDWFQLSLKEGLTVFRDQEFSSDLGCRAVERIKEAKVMRSVQFAEDMGPMAHPIRPDMVIEQNNFYTVTVYEKGAEVIRMLHTVIGEENFQKGMKLYISRFDGGCATCEDFVRAMEDASGSDLGQFRNWYQYDGTPVVDVLENYDPSSRTLTVELSQSFESTHYRNRSDYPAMVIPLKPEVISGNGKIQKLTDPAVDENGLLLFSQKFMKLVFTDIDSEPCVTYLGNFSAPVKLRKNYSLRELRSIIACGSDNFNRYDAMWSLYCNYFRAVVEQGQEPENAARDITDIFREILKSGKYDGLYLSELLSVPSEMQIMEIFDRFDVEGIHRGRTALKKILAAELDPLWYELFVSSSDHDPYVWDFEHSCRRSARALALDYLCLGRGNSFAEEVTKIYDSSDNMTDRMSALGSAVYAGLDVASGLLGKYRQQWHGNGLMMDNWFRVQALVPATETLEKIRELMSDPDFSMSNPNRIRSLIGSFVMSNPYGFHGRGEDAYRFLTEILSVLNSSNPQTAARLVEAFMQFRRFDQKRSDFMRNELNKLSCMKDLASDLYEKITRSLKA